MLATILILIALIWLAIVLIAHLPLWLLLLCLIVVVAFWL
jgi:hypothetical protein